jgi:hypothetical protein
MDGMTTTGERRPAMTEETARSANLRHPVLDVFGMKLEVSNARLAELLTMDAKDALATDVRELVSTSDDAKQTRLEAEEAVPEVLLAAPTPHDEEDARLRREFRQSVQETGVALGFDAGADGVWRSPTGVAIVTRAIEKPVSFAAATHYVTELAARREAIAGEDSTALFVVDSQLTADVFKVAVRQRRLHDVMRTVSIDNLSELRRLHMMGQLDHQRAVVLLVPIANIDVGELLSILHAGGANTAFEG